MFGQRTLRSWEVRLRSRSGRPSFPRSRRDSVALVEPVNLWQLLRRDEVARASPHWSKLQLAANHVSDPFGREFPLVLVSVSIHQPACNALDREGPTGVPQVADAFENLCFKVHAPLVDHLAVIAAGERPKLLAVLRVTRHREERQKDLIEPWLDRQVGGQHFALLSRFEIPEAIEEQLVPQALRLVFEGRRQAYRDDSPQHASAGFLGEAAALECPILEEAARRNQLGTVHLVGARIELATVRGRLAAEHGKALGVPVVQNLHNLRLFIGKAEVAFIDEHRAPKRIQNAEERRNRRSARSENRLVAERAYCEH